MRKHRALRVVFTAVTAALLFIISAIPAWSMTVTFVRHGESQANAAHIIETDIPGRGLTPQGEAEAAAIAAELADRNFDRIYSSPLKRTMDTAGHLTDIAGQPAIQPLIGLREIPGGWFEGSSDADGIERLLYGMPAFAWTLGLRFIPVLGSEDGNAFDARMDATMRQIYEDGDADDNVVAFGHGATIMFWTMMNVDNPDLILMATNVLGNTDTVVIEGSPDEGWTLVEWAGHEVNPNPSLITKLLVNTRDLIVAPQTALYNIGQALQTGDIVQIADAVRDGLVDVTTTTLRFVPNVVHDVVDSVRELLPRTAERPAPTGGAETLRTTEPEPVTTTPADTAERIKATAEDRVTVERKLLPRKATPSLVLIDDTTVDDQKVADQKANGATDLSVGNKVEPGQVSSLSTPRDQARAALQGVGEQLGAVVDRFTGTAADRTPATGANTDTDNSSDRETSARDAA